MHRSTFRRLNIIAEPSRIQNFSQLPSRDGKLSSSICNICRIDWPWRVMITATAHLWSISKALRYIPKRPHVLWLWLPAVAWKRKCRCMKLTWDKRCRAKLARDPQSAFKRRCQHTGSFNLKGVSKERMPPGLIAASCHFSGIFDDVLTLMHISCDTW